jgi:hypothetical protein
MLMKQGKNKKKQEQSFNWMPVILLAVVLIGALVFAFRSPQAPAIDPPAPAATLVPLPAGVIEQAGYVVALPVQGVQTIYLFAEPDQKAEKIGEVTPGDQGELLGQDAGGEWLYLCFGDKTGWAPIFFFSVTAVQ